MTGEMIKGIFALLTVFVFVPGVVLFWVIEEERSRWDGSNSCFLGYLAHCVRASIIILLVTKILIKLC